jgi:serine phosphatase RsbU (regulator of sigma subunit)
LVIADVSDKGMPAALFMAMVRSTVRASVGHAASPAEGIALANRLICADASGGMFVTLFYAQLDLATGEMIYVNAGHNPPPLVRAGSAAPDCMIELRRTGMALGVMADTRFEQRTVRLEHRDLVLLYTDGITDALDRRERGFGVQRLQGVLVRRRDARVDDLVTMVERELAAHVGDGSPFDDVTMVAARRE